MILPNRLSRLLAFSHVDELILKKCFIFSCKTSAILCENINVYKISLLKSGSVIFNHSATAVEIKHNNRRENQSSFRNRFAIKILVRKGGLL